MAFGSTLTFTIDGNAVTLNRINQDGYSSEYFVRDSTGEYRCKVSHSTFTRKKNAALCDRHIVDLTQTIYGVGDEKDVIRRCSTLLEFERADVVSDTIDFGVGFAAKVDNTMITDLCNLLS